MKSLLSNYFLLLLLLPFHLEAQLKNEHFRTETFTTDEDLAHDFTSCIIQDKTGFIWTGTHNGLSRFDGHSFKNFLNIPGDSTSLSTTHIESMLEDSNGQIWIGTINGLDLFNPKNEVFTHISNLPGCKAIKGIVIKALAEDLKGNIWIGTYGKGLYCFNPTSKKIKEFRHIPGNENSLSSDYINSLYAHDNGNIFIGTWGGGLNILNAETEDFIHHSSLSENKDLTINSIQKDKKGDLLIGTWNKGLYKYDIRKELFSLYNSAPELILHDIFTSTPIISALTDKEGMLWIATFTRGIVVYNPRTNEVFNFSNESDQFFIKGNMTLNILEDRSGVIWVSTLGGGIVKIVKKNKSFRHIRNFSSHHSDSYINFIYQDNSQKIWLGTRGKGLYLLNEDLHTIEPIEKHLRKSDFHFPNSAMCIRQDKLNKFWIGTQKGIITYDPSSEKTSLINTSEMLRPFKQKLDNTGIFCINVDSVNAIWLGTFGAGVFRYDQHTEQFRHYHHDDTKPNSLSNDVVWVSLTDHRNNLWFGTRNLLNRYNPAQDNFRIYYPDTTQANSISHHVISCLFEDSKKRLWIGTLGGGVNLYRHETDDFTYLNRSHGLPDNSIHSIVEDANGNLWFSTPKGLSTYNPVTHEILNYDKNSGLSDNIFNMGSSALLHSGELCFGGNSGLNIFHPDSLHGLAASPVVVISDFKLFNKSVVPGKEINGRVILPFNINDLEELRLNYNDYVISFEFSVLDYAFPNSNDFAYKLEGFDKEWIYTDSKRRFVTYTNLAPGKYTFMVKANNHNGLWNDTPKTLSIIIAPPFWKTTWFKITGIILLVISINIFFRYKVRSYRRQRTVLKRLVLKKTRELMEQNTILEKVNSDLNRQKEEILMQKDAILEMTKKVKEADEKKTKFFTNISHEFRTPLTLILGPIENLLSKKSGNEKDLEQLAFVRKNANRLLRLVNELLDFNKIDNNQMQLKLCKGDLVEFCSEIFFSFEEWADKKQVQLLFSPNTQEIFTFFDPSKIEIILYNLISNALKFTPEGGIVKLSLIFQEVQNNILLVVNDNGIGICPEKLNLIFDRYYQIESADHQHHGSGIGLSLTKELVELMSGHITVNSQPGKETTFTVTLPVIDEINNSSALIISGNHHPKPDTQLLSAFLPHENNFSNDDSSGLVNPKSKILVIDDNEDLRVYIKTCLYDHYEIHEASNGKEGLIMLNKIQPQLVISDVMMPEIGGIELCRIIKTDITTSHIPVILLTAKANIEAHIEGYETGADDYITKPFSKDLLKARIENLIISRQKLREIFKYTPGIQPHDGTFTSTDEKFLTKAMEIVENNMENPEFGASQLVKELGMSRTLVHMKFKELLNTSTGEFIKTNRLKKACLLLKQNRYRVSEICYMVGFSDPHYFSKAFRALYGVSPTHYTEAKIE